MVSLLSSPLIRVLAMLAVGGIAVGVYSMAPSPSPSPQPSFLTSPAASSSVPTSAPPSQHVPGASPVATGASESAREGNTTPTPFQGPVHRATPTPQASDPSPVPATPQLTVEPTPMSTCIIIPHVQICVSLSPLPLPSLIP